MRGMILIVAIATVSVSGCAQSRAVQRPVAGCAETIETPTAWQRFKSFCCLHRKKAPAPVVVETLPAAGPGVTVTPMQRPDDGSPR